MAKTRKEQLFEQLEETQQKAIYMLLEREQYSKSDERYKSLDKIADDLGVVRKTLYNWRMRDRIFQEALEETSREYLAALAPKAAGAMFKLLDSAQPLTKALDLYFKSQNWVKNEQKIDITTNGRNDVSAELSEMMKQAKQGLITIDERKQ